MAASGQRRSWIARSGRNTVGPRLAHRPWLEELEKYVLMAAGDFLYGTILTPSAIYPTSSVPAIGSFLNLDGVGGPATPQLSAAGLGTDAVVGTLTVTDLGFGAAIDTYGPTTITVKVTIRDVASSQFGSVTFTGSLVGVVRNSGFESSAVFVNPAFKSASPTVTLGGLLYTVTADPSTDFAAPGSPGTGVIGLEGRIVFHVTQGPAVAPEQPTPTPPASSPVGAAIHFQYGTSLTPSPIIPTSSVPAIGSIFNQTDVGTFAAPTGDEFDAAAALGAEIVVGTTTVTDLGFGEAYTDTYGPTPITVQLAIKDVASGMRGTVTFTGSLAGTVSSKGAARSSHFSNPGFASASPTIALGANRYTITVDPTADFTAPGGDFGSGLEGSYCFRVTAAVDLPPVAQDDTYTAVAGSTLTVPAPGILNNDSDPDGDTLSIDVVTFPAHGSFSITTSGAGAGGFSYSPSPSFSGTDTFTYRDFDGTLFGNTATVTLNVNASADLAVTKVDSPDPVIAGNNITYTVALTNNGPSDAQSVALADTLPTGTTFVSATAPAGWTTTAPAVGGTGAVTFTRPTVAAGAAPSFTIVVHVGANVASGSTIANTATATTTTTDPNNNNNSGSAFTTVNTSADLVVTKTDTPDPVTAGTLLTYTINLTNSGPSDAQNVSLSDTIPAGTTFAGFINASGWSVSTPTIGGTGVVNFSRATVPAGASPTFTIFVNVGAGVLAGTVISNSATAASTTPDPNSANSTGTTTTTVAASADLVATKVGSPDPVIAGNKITYTITVTNNGPSDAQAYNVPDTPPAGTTVVSYTQTSGPAVFGVLPAGATATFTLIATVDSNVPAGTVLTNSVTVTSTTPDPNGTNNTTTASTTVATSADLAVIKVASPNPVNAGSNLTYSITLTNNGPGDAQAVSLTDGIPAGTTFVSATAPGGWTTSNPVVGGTGTVTFARASFAAGASPTFTIVVQAGNNPAANVSNTVNVSSSTSDPNPSNNSATINTPINGAVDLVVTKTTSPNPVFAGGNLTYTVIVQNAGFAPAANVKLYDLLPDRTTFVSNSGAPGWSSINPAAGASGGVITSTTPSFGAGATASFVIVVRVPTDVRPGTVLTNRAVVTTSSGELNGNNNSTTASVTVTSPPPVAPAVRTAGLAKASPSGGSKGATSVSVQSSAAQAQDQALAISGGLVADVLRQKTLSGLFAFGG